MQPDLQGSLAELKLEVAAARQLSSHVSASLPSTGLLSPLRHADAHRHLHHPAASMSARCSNGYAGLQTHDVFDTANAATAADMSQLQQRMQAMSSSIHQLEAATSSSKSLEHLSAQLRHLEQQVQKLQGNTEAGSALQQQIHQHIQSWQECELPQRLQPVTHQV